MKTDSHLGKFVIVIFLNKNIFLLSSDFSRKFFTSNTRSIIVCTFNEKNDNFKSNLHITRLNLILNESEKKLCNFKPFEPVFSQKQYSCVHCTLKNKLV